MFYTLNRLGRMAKAVAGWLDAFVDDDVLPLSHRDQIKNPSGLGFGFFYDVRSASVLAIEHERGKVSCPVSKLKTASSSTACRGAVRGWPGGEPKLSFSRFFFLIFLTS